jgi:hypothetical protein
VTEQPLGGDRQPFAGTMRQLKEDVRKAEESGLTELVLETNFLPDVHGKDDFLRHLENLRQLV